jgi:hypothetical protein
MPPASQKFCFATLVPSKYDILSPSICLTQSGHPTNFGWTLQVTKGLLHALVILAFSWIALKIVDLCSIESLAWQRRLHNWNSDKQPTSNQNSSTLSPRFSKHTLPGWSIHGERLGERLAIRVPRTYNCVVPLAVRKTLRTVLDACLQLPENPDLPRWFQAKMTFQVNLSDTKRAHRQDVYRITFRNHLQLR